MADETTNQVPAAPKRPEPKPASGKPKAQLSRNGRGRLPRGERVYYDVDVQMVALEDGFYRTRRCRKGTEFVLKAGDLQGSWMAFPDSAAVEQSIRREADLPHAASGSMAGKTMAEVARNEAAARERRMLAKTQNDKRADKVDAAAHQLRNENRKKAQEQ